MYRWEQRLSLLSTTAVFIRAVAQLSLTSDSEGLQSGSKRTNTGVRLTRGLCLCRIGPLVYIPLTDVNKPASSTLLLPPVQQSSFISGSHLIDPARLLVIPSNQNTTTVHLLTGPAPPTMASKKKAPIDDELGELFEGLGDDAASKKTAKPKSAASKARDAAGDDILAELENQLGDQPARPHTPRIKEASKRSSTATPPPAASRLSEDKPSVPRKSGESARSYHASFTPSATSSEYQENEKRAPIEQSAPEPAPASAAAAAAAAGGGGWWGGLGGIIATASATANAARKQAEAAYTQIQQNEDAKKYLEQVKGNVGYIKNYGKSDDPMSWVYTLLHCASPWHLMRHLHHS